MSQLAGLLSRKGEDVTQRLLGMLGSPVRHNAYGIATPDGSEHSPHPLDFTSLIGNVAIAHRLVKVHPTDNPQPIHDGGKAVAFLGRLWDTPEPGAPVAADALRVDAEEGLRTLLTEHEGSWAAAIACEDTIRCARDTMGAVPLYYGQNTELIGVSTDTKTLIRLGMEPNRVKPGHIVTLGIEGVGDREGATLVQPPQTSINLNEATDELDKLLTLAASRTCRGLNSPTLAFSGGIDSTLLARYMKLVGSHPRLTCVGAVDSPDLAAAETAADALDLPLSIKTFTDSDLNDHLNAILRSVEEADPMKVGVAAPLYFVALEAATKPCRAVFSGNGSDELFGGYAKYAEEYQKHGESVRETMFRDVTRSHEVNLERDWKICSDIGLELRLPYADPELTWFALCLPLKHKLPATGREPRKIILRHLAKRLGLPSLVAEKPKKAAQYSSGTGKMIERLAKKRGKTTGGYLAERLKEAMRNE
jgi:asparagine synthase (glutamine-hydrolysing)